MKVFCKWTSVCLVLLSLMSGIFIKPKDYMAEPSEPVVFIEIKPEATIPLYKEVIRNYIDPSIQYQVFEDTKDIAAELEKIDDYISSLHSATYLKATTEELIKALEIIDLEVERVLTIKDQYQKDYEDIAARELEEQKWQQRMEEYPVATTVWRYMTETMGYSDAVAAGIMGNMMSECGGQTLNLQWQIRNSSGHYGLCQWSKGFAEVQGADLQGQLEFLAKSLPDNFNYWASVCYKKGFTYQKFLAMTDASEVAYAFCVIYERPGPGSYEQRERNAQMALKYFTT